MGCTHQATVELPSAPEAGTYRVELIQPGKEKSTTQPYITGQVVLFSQPIKNRKGLILWSEGSGQRANGCYRLKIHQEVQDSFAGIVTDGFLNWTINASDEIEFMLYQSADAGYIVRITEGADGFTGIGKSWGSGIAALKPTPPTELVSVQRTGSPAMSHCPPLPEWPYDYEGYEAHDG